MISIQDNATTNINTKQWPWLMSHVLSKPKKN